jgi:hypothetical protein
MYNVLVTAIGLVSVAFFVVILAGLVREMTPQKHGKSQNGPVEPI